MRIFLLGFIFFFFIAGASAQSTRDAGGVPPPVYQSSKKTKKFFLFRMFERKESVKKPMEETEKFEARMKAVAKQKAKEARIAGKPEYANKFYFGHKREPKKRKPGKKKWCKICEFVH